MLMKSINSFFASESGAVTVDWVVLTAAVAGIGLLVLTVIVTGVNANANIADDEVAAAHGMSAGLVAD